MNNIFDTSCKVRKCRKLPLVASHISRDIKYLLLDIENISTKLIISKSKGSDKAISKLFPEVTVIYLLGDCVSHCFFYSFTLNIIVQYQLT